ncbi:MAG: methyl-accepting chemotaxis protein [Gammaproteobacteria bacterium]|nr:methyl-accepting chemotaxis protein [Gammaproteobacteria bacterium]
MSTFLSPAIALMDRLSYQKKMAIVAILFLIPLSVTTYQVIKVSSDTISAARSEQIGITYIKLLRQFQQHVAEHRYLSSVVLSNKTDGDKLSEKNSEIEGDIKLIDEATQQNENTLGAAAQWTGIKSSWEKLKSSTSMSVEESKKAHDALIHDVISLYGGLSASSGLILDPSLDAIHLVLALTTDIPKAAEHGGQVRYYGMVFLTANRALTFNEKAQMLIDFEGSGMALEATDDEIQATLKISPDLKELLSGPLEGGIKNNSQLLGVVKKEILDENWNITSQEYNAMATKAVNSYFALFDVTGQALEQLLNARLAHEQQKRFLIIGLVISSLAVVLYFFMGFYRSSMQSIGNLVTASQQISDGDLCARIKTISGDELGAVAKTFNNMAEKFRSIIQQMATTSTHLATASEELSSVTQESKAGVQQQQNEFTQLATAITEMSATIQEVARNAAEAALSAEKADKSVVDGRRVIKDTMDAINKLTAQVESATGVINNLAKESENIGGVLSIIDGIAEQTNLLALNAAIEAARAGEQGRGFAVVADEVRTLAQRTKDSTHEIQQMIVKFRSGTSEAVKVMEQSYRQSQDGRNFAEKAGASFTEITSEVNKISSMNQQIATAAEEQSSVADEINRNIHKVTEIVDQVAAGTEQIAAASEGLAKLAAESQSGVARFKV